MTLLVLAIVGLMVLVVTVTPPRTSTRDAASAPSARVSGPRDEFDVEATLTADGRRAPQTIEAELGDNVAITVEGLRPGSVSLGDVRTAVYEEGLPAQLDADGRNDRCLPAGARR